ncbi:hypothetical protein POX_b02728 [Penicillium oxalicum]|uniref:Uncharacterized protein n=1 Tax=Penicillium oxalicum (strain 114-2 / CGMCC 5302) TaxID=933388 RepID=S8B6I0_PENO1|nr:hypothetical protein POX_b02728 [Penicillium oxalicum]EPS30262.1 hypothetical protein PDE_05213 [Penicillium oxalicum 114-2]KAI2792687.1 hypothetical protein POX_b02728 [Penicillium oxalicum]
MTTTAGGPVRCKVESPPRWPSAKQAANFKSGCEAASIPGARSNMTPWASPQ